MDIKIINLLKNGKIQPTLSKFLTVDEQNNLISNEVNILFSNSYELEERKRAFLFPKNEDITPNFKISFLEVISKEPLKHSDVLGSLMGLGITREVIGDIITSESTYIIVASEIEKYIIDNLNQINKNKVEVKKIEELLNTNQNNYIKASIIISSMRLDGILSKSINLSREKAQELIKMRVVRINGKVCIDNDYHVNENDIISITKFGRIIIKDVARTTKKDKIVLNIEKTK